MNEAVNFLSNKVDVRFVNKVYRQVLGLPMGTYWAPLKENVYCFDSQSITKLKERPVYIAFNLKIQHLPLVWWYFPLNSRGFSKYTSENIPKGTFLRINQILAVTTVLLWDIPVLHGKLFEKMDNFAFPCFFFLNWTVRFLLHHRMVFISQLLHYACVCCDA